MNKAEILDIVNEPSKHIQIAKIVGEDRIVYSSKFVELLELIPTMLTKADVVATLTELKHEIDEIPINPNTSERFRLGQATAYDKCELLVQQKIDKLEEN